MIHFAYPDVDTEEDQFSGCGRYAVSESVPEGYDLPFAKILNRSKVSDAALILAKDSSDKEIKDQVIQKKGEKYIGESLHLAYLFALIHRSREVKLNILTDIWTTGSIEVSDGKPFLKSVKHEGFQLKLEKGFLSEENEDMLFIVPEGDIQPEHEDLCSKNNAEILSFEAFRDCLSKDKEIFQKKIIVKVREDELFALVSLIFELGPNPYKGLEYFDEEDADRFFGREDVTEKLFEKYQTLQDSPIRLMAILGPSGSGKSSIARAGLIHKIRHSADHQDIVFRPGGYPLKAFTEELAKNNPSDPDVILVDQFEEIYTQCKDEAERNLFVRNLLHASSDEDSRVSVIIILRTDFLKQTKNHHPELYNAIAENEIIVKAMTRNQIRSVITEPARRSGYIFDMETVDRLISETEKHEGALPLLEFALDSIWKGMEKEGVQPADTLEKLNGVGGALASRAQEIYDGLASDTDRRIARRAFISLINIGEGAFDTRRRVLLSQIVAKDESSEHVRNVLQQFSKTGKAYFITLSTDAEGKETAEITHEALFEHWGSLKQWLDEKRDDLPFIHRLEKASSHWKNQDKPDGLLWRTPDLDSLKDYHRHNKQDMTELQHVFFEASVEAEKREEAEKEAIRQRELRYARDIAEEQRKRAEEQEEAGKKLRKRFIFALGFALIAILALIAAVSGFLKATEQTGVAEQEQNKAEQERDKALRNQSLQLVVSAQTEMEKGNIVTGMMLALEALPKNMSAPERPYVPEAENKLYESVAYFREPLVVIEGDKPFVYAVFSPDGKRIVTGSFENIARVWDTETGKELVSLKGHEKSVVYASFSPDGSRIVTASWDNTARLWDNDTGEQLAVLEGHEGGVDCANFDYDGKRIITASSDKTACIWDAYNGKQLAIMKGHEDDIAYAAFSPDGKYAVTGGGSVSESEDNTVRLWEAESGKQLTIIQGHIEMVRCVGFSPNGQLLISASLDETSRIWDIYNRKQLILQHEASVNHAEFSTDGRKIVTASNKGVARVWDVATGQQTAIMEGHKTPVNHATFSPDGKYIVTASGNFIGKSVDNTARLWNANTGELLNIMLHEKSVEHVAFSPDGKKIVTASWDKTIRIWDANSGGQYSVKEIILPKNPEDSVIYVDVSSDKNYMITAYIET